MKKLTLLFALCVLFTVGANAQEFKKFRWAVGLGYAKPSGEGAGGGVLWATEFGYRLSDPICLSLRIEGAAVVRGLSESVNGYDNAEVAGISSYTANGIYYLSNNKFRPYVGAGVGLFSLAAVSFDANSAYGAASESKIGFYPRIGFDLGHFNVNIDYNIIGNTKFEGVDVESKNSYLGVRIGGFFFGGRN
jgi:hypothetical protein